MTPTVHFESPSSSEGRPVCASRSPEVTRDHRDVTCTRCQESEDFLAYRDMVDFANSLPEERESEPDTITILRRALAEKSIKKIDGVPVDIQTAHAIVTVYDAPQVVANPRFREKFAALPILAMAETAWKLVTPQESSVRA